MGENGGTWLEGDFESALEMPLDPNPAEAAIDVSRDAILSWKPGVYAHRHDVYFGTNFDDVNDATTVDPNNVYQGRQVPNRFPISGTSNLEFGQTYYRRIRWLRCCIN